MRDVLVRDVPEEVIAALEARAARLGLSRSEFLRRRLAQEAATGLGVTGCDRQVRARPACGKPRCGRLG